MDYTNIVLLAGALVMLVGMMAGKVGTRLGVPALLIFLITGMIFGSSGFGLEYSDTGKTQFFGTIALTVILFCGGFETRVSDIRPVLGPGIMLSTVGVLLTTVFLGAVFYYLGKVEYFGMALTFPVALLLAATMSSTDSASVFGLLREQRMHLKEGLKPILELESGSNDPMAYMLTIALMQYVIGEGGGSGWTILVTFVLQFGVGIGLGYLMGRFGTWFINKVNISNEALYPILILCLVFATFALTSILQGNGFLAVYLMGVVMGNRRLVHKKSILTFFDGITWLVQIVLFILLGLYVNAESLVVVAPFALLSAVLMILVVRPLATFVCLLFFPHISFNGRLFLSWVGLRGAVPIIFATMPLLAGVEGAYTLFNIVFFITLVSLLVQGSTLPYVAKHLGLDEEVEESVSLFGVEIPQHTGAQMEERPVVPEMLSAGNLLMEIDLRDEELVILVRRGDRYIVPKGKLELATGDVLLIVSESETL